MGKENKEAACLKKFLARKEARSKEIEIGRQNRITSYRWRKRRINIRTKQKKK